MNFTELGYALKLQGFLHKANPDRKPLEDEIELLVRIVHVLLTSPRTLDYRERLGKERDERYLHAIGRDRRDFAAMLAGSKRGATHWRGKKIAGSAKHPHVMRWTRKQVHELRDEVMDVCGWDFDELTVMLEIV